MKQMTLAAAKGFEKHNRATRKAEFLARMESLMPWAEFCVLIEPHYPKVGNGRPPVGLERMLRMYCIANWFNLSDLACEDALYYVPVFREFCHIDLGRERVPMPRPCSTFVTCSKRTISVPHCLPRSASCCWPTV
jgi:IS5 family transposase